MEGVPSEGVFNGILANAAAVCITSDLHVIREEPGWHIKSAPYLL